MKHLPILLILLAFTCCTLPDFLMMDPDAEPIPVFPVDTIPVDTIAEPILIDTCAELIHYSDPVYTVISLWFVNGAPLSNEWYWQGSMTPYDSISHLLQAIYPQYDYTVYEGNGAVTVFVDGVTNNTLFQGKIWTRDLINQKAIATAFGRSHYHYGAMTFEEAMHEGAKRRSHTGFHSINTDWSPAQDDAYARTMLHAVICKHGEWWASFKESSTQQSIIDSFALFEWSNVVLLGSWENPETK